MRKRWFKALALGLPLIFSAAPFVGTKANAHEVTQNDLMIRGLTQPMADLFVPLAGNMFSFTPNQIATTDVGAFFMYLMGGMRYWMEGAINGGPDAQDDVRPRGSDRGHTLEGRVRRHAHPGLYQRAAF